jgi:hypothetical protein
MATACHDQTVVSTGVLQLHGHVVIRLGVTRPGARVDRNAGLDPEVDYLRIAQNLSLHEFPWDTLQALSFALFRTYAVPSIGRLLDQTGAFNEQVQKRYDDTAILLEMPVIHGFDSQEGKDAIRRINQMHRMYDISNDDFRYVLSTFVVVPHRWIDAYGWRKLTDVEVLATIRYYQELGRRMGIKDIPGTYEEFADLMDSYERDHFAYDEGARRVADRTLELMCTFYPAPLRPAVEVFSRAMMDEPLIRAFGFKEPGRFARRIAALSLKLRARFVALLPPRRKPSYVHEMARIKSYPGGFIISEMGTFPKATRPTLAP